jgi:hypothetical protein
MLYFHFTLDTLDGIASKIDHSDRGWQNRNDFRNMPRAEQVAKAATEFSGELYIASDAGPCVSPRYDVVRAPKIGDAVSYGFNGDYYPDGEIVHITPGSLRIIKTSTGGTYYKRGDRAAWIKKGGTWSLVSGTHNERNPEF